MIQQSIFDMLYQKYKIDKPIRLIEFFAGYGSQALALKYLGVKFEHWKICEWAVKSIQAYKDIHFTNEHLTFNKDRTKEDMVEYLYQKGISANYNEPMKKQQIARLNEKQLKTILENIAITHNLVNIQQVKGTDLELIDLDKVTYLLTYSFPCQDLSLAGKRKGMNDTSTRSGMLWEVERILDECKELGTLPQVLLMENVTQVHNEVNVDNFNKWQLKLEELGYKNYWKDLIATDYGIPQIRNRCFMISILGDYNYSFPPKQKLKLKLKDMLEQNVDKKYMISSKMLQGMISSKFHQYQLENRLQDINGNIDTLTTSTGARCPHCIPIKNATKKGYLEATDGDGIDISSRMKYHRGTVQKDKSQTITTMGGENNGVVITNNYIQWKQKGHLDIDCRAYFENKVAPTTTTTPKSKILQNDLKVRKLTPRECFRLMGVRDEDYDKVAKNQSDSSLYHLAGDSIVVNVLMAIFKEMI